MRDDDYDQQAYPDILETLYELPVRLSASRAGRHNDAMVRIIGVVCTSMQIMEKETLWRNHIK